MLAVTICQLFYGIPSLSLMLFFFLLPMFERKTLSNPFYRLLQIDLFVNITCYLNTWIALRLSQEDLGYEFLKVLEHWAPGILTISSFMCRVYFHLQNFTGIFLALYRFTSINCLNTDHYWRRFYLLIPVLGVAYCLFILSPWWMSGNFIVRIVIINGEMFRKTQAKAMFVLSSVDCFFAIFYFLLVLLLGVWTTRVAMNRYNKHHSQRFSNFIKKMTRIVYCNSFLMSGNLLFLVFLEFLLMIRSIRDTVREHQTTVVTFTSDLFTLAMPYILLLFDSNIRRKLGIERPEKSDLYSTKTANYSPRN